METPIKIFSGRSSKEIANKIANSFGVKLGNETVVEFSDGEKAVIPRANLEMILE